MTEGQTTLLIKNANIFMGDVLPLLDRLSFLSLIDTSDKETLFSNIIDKAKTYVSENKIKDYQLYTLGFALLESTWHELGFDEKYKQITSDDLLKFCGRICDEKDFDFIITSQGGKSKKVKKMGETKVSTTREIKELKELKTIRMGNATDARKAVCYLFSLPLIDCTPSSSSTTSSSSSSSSSRPITSPYSSSSSSSKSIIIPELLPTPPSESELPREITFTKTRCNYPVGKKMGQGTYGIVYLASPKIGLTKIKPNETIVLKAMKKDAVISGEELDEIIYQQILKSPYIVPILGVDTKCDVKSDIYSSEDSEDIKDNATLQGKYISILMPKAISTLENLLNNPKWTFASNFAAPGIKALRFKIAHDIICGINYMHKKGLMHLDLKPANILLFLTFYSSVSPAIPLSTTSTDNFGIRALIADFGLTQNINGNRWRKPNNIGTRLYRDPRLLCELEERYNQSADIWSLGIILTRLFFGYFPFGGTRTGTEIDDTLQSAEIFMHIDPGLEFNTAVKSKTKYGPCNYFIEEGNRTSLSWPTTPVRRTKRARTEITHPKVAEIKEYVIIPKLPKSVEELIPNRESFHSYYTPEEYKAIWQVINAALEFDRSKRATAEELLSMRLFNGYAPCLHSVTSLPESGTGTTELKFVSDRLRSFISGYDLPKNVEKLALFLYNKIKSNDLFSSIDLRTMLYVAIDLALKYYNDDTTFDTLGVTSAEKELTGFYEDRIIGEDVLNLFQGYNE